MIINDPFHTESFTELSLLDSGPCHTPQVWRIWPGTKLMIHSDFDWLTSDKSGNDNVLGLA